jgi:hypothetical protein
MEVESNIEEKCFKGIHSFLENRGVLDNETQPTIEERKVEFSIFFHSFKNSIVWSSQY